MRAILIEKTDAGSHASLAAIPDSRLPEGEVRVAISHSTLNYKDSLAICQGAPVVRSFPLVPGVDFAGAVMESAHPGYQPGDAVMCNGWGIGELHWGGLAQQARVKAEWLIPLPQGFTPAQAMALGTAGYTAMLCVMRLEELGCTPDKGEAVVTGATGGVGSVATAVLAKLGYSVAAVTGKPQEADYLHGLGAASIVPRQELQSSRPLEKERFAAGVDTVGSQVLAGVLSRMRYGGVLAACGLAQGPDLPATVMPFILRGVTLAGVECVYRPKEQRMRAWQRLGELLPAPLREGLCREIGLPEVMETARRQLAGEIRGRIVVDVNR